MMTKNNDMMTFWKAYLGSVFNLFNSFLSEVWMPPPFSTTSLDEINLTGSRLGLCACLPRPFSVDTTRGAQGNIMKDHNRPRGLVATLKGRGYENHPHIFVKLISSTLVRSYDTSYVHLHVHVMKQRASNNALHGVSLRILAQHGGSARGCKSPSCSFNRPPFSMVGVCRVSMCLGSHNQTLRLT